MGNYSYIIDQEGCKLDFEKLKKTCKERKIEHFDWIRDKKLLAERLGEAIDGWKIQGYWYNDFVKFLYTCADCMIGLTKNKSDNMIEMEEEQGFKFEIYFFLNDNNQPVIEVSYVPMEWVTMGLGRDGSTS